MAMDIKLDPEGDVGGVQLPTSLIDRGTISSEVASSGVIAEIAILRSARTDSSRSVGPQQA
jgi:hypothetical protein